MIQTKYLKKVLVDCKLISERQVVKITTKKKIEIGIKPSVYSKTIFLYYSNQIMLKSISNNIGVAFEPHFFYYS